MRILNPGEPCPCCGMPIKEGLPVETIILLSWLQEGKGFLATIESTKNMMPKEESARWKDWLRDRFERKE